jgi:hypothetical protein
MEGVTDPPDYEGMAETIAYDLSIEDVALEYEMSVAEVESEEEEDDRGTFRDSLVDVAEKALRKAPLPAGVAF